MPSPATLVPWALWPLVLGIGLQLLSAKVFSSRGKGVLAFLCCLGSLGAVLGTYPGVRDGSAIHLHLGTWDGPLALVFHVDALSLLFAFMATGIGALVLLYAIDYMSHEPAATRFYSIILAFVAGLVVLVYSANLLLFYLGWELVGLCSFSLVGFWYKNPEAVKGARKVLLMTHLAGYGLLAAILIIYARTGSVLWTDPAVGQAMTGVLFVLMLTALAAKSVQFPLHTWIPEAMAAPTPVSALLHAACYVKAGVYLAARMHSFTRWPESWSVMMLWVGTVTMLVGVLYALVQTDLKRLLAFSTVSQIGYMITGIGLGTPLGIAAGLLHCINHGFFKSSLFLAAGSVQHATGTRDMDQLGGLASKMPRTTAVWMIGVGSMMGIPLMSGFASKWLVYTAALQKGMVVPALAAWIASIGTVYIGVKATSSVFLGNTQERTKHAHESPAMMTLGMGLLSVVTIGLGIAPQVAIRLLINPVLAAFGMPATVGVSWFGMTDAMGSWAASMGLVMAVVSAIIGGIVYLVVVRPARVVMARGAFAGAGGGAFTGGEPIAGPAKMPAGDFSAVLRRQWSPIMRALDVDAFYLGFWRLVLDCSTRMQQALSWVETNATTALIAASVVVLLAVHRAVPNAALFTEAGGERVPLLIGAASALALLALVITAAASRAWRNLAGWMFVTGAPAVLGLFVTSATLRLVLLEASSFLALLLIWKSAKTKSAVWTFLTVIAVSAATLIPGLLLLEHGHAELARTLLITGFFLKLGLVPFFLWLPKLAEQVPALVLGLVICVLDIAAFGELCLVAKAAPWVLEPRGLWLCVAALSALAAALLMLAQRNLKRMLALSTVEDMGFLCFGLAASSVIGFEGAVFGAAAHAVAKALLFISISSPEADGELKSNSRGLASRYPVSAAGFLIGMLAVLGIPPTIGFAGRWRIYEAAAQLGTGWMTVMILSSMLALIAYVRALTRMWWGVSPEEAVVPSAAVETGAAKIWIVLLAALLVIAGVLPSGLEFLTRGIQ
jgi:multicomponent Na+:H+ antiporter subunit A